MHNPILIQLYLVLLVGQPAFLDEVLVASFVTEISVADMVGIDDIVADPVATKIVAKRASEDMGALSILSRLQRYYYCTQTDIRDTPQLLPGYLLDRQLTSVSGLGTFCGVPNSGSVVFRIRYTTHGPVIEVPGCA
jgi:hypothetical protein